MNKEKKLYLEVIRIVAFVCVMFNHTGEYGYEYFKVTDNLILQIISMILSNLCKIGVPLFFMVSGALLIPKMESVKQLYRNRILRMLIILVVFSFAYYLRLYICHPEYGFSIKYFIQLVYQQPFVTPFWFLYMYLSFLIMLPLLRKMSLAMSNDDYVYFVAVIAVFSILISCTDFVINENCYLSVPIIVTNIIYPVLGYYLDSLFDEARVVNKSSKVVYLKKTNMVSIALIFTVINSIICIVLTHLSFLRTGEWTSQYIETFIFVPTISIFYIIKSMICNKELNDVLVKIVKYIGGSTFTVYLFEEILRIDVCMKIYEYFADAVNPLILYVPYAVLLYSCGIIIATVLKRIPGIKKVL